MSRHVLGSRDAVERWFDQARPGIPKRTINSALDKAEASPSKSIGKGWYRVMPGIRVRFVKIEGRMDSWEVDVQV